MNAELELVKPCGRCPDGGAAPPGSVASWHHASDGLVGYRRCRCGGLMIVRPATATATSPAERRIGRRIA